MRFILAARCEMAAQHMGLTVPDKPALALAATAAALLFASGAHAAPPVPRVKPAPQPFTRTLSPAEFETLRMAFQAADKGDWATVRTLEGLLQDPVAQKLVIWRIATSDENTSFRELSGAVQALEGWPNTNAMLRDAEYALGDMAAGAVSAQEVARWFSDHPPQSGEGKAAHAEALMALGLEADADRVLRDVWTQNSLRSGTQARIKQLYGSRFTLEETLERIDFLAFDDQRNAVRDLIPMLPPDYQALYRARLAIAGNDSDLLARLNAVPARLQNDPGLLYERARRLRRNGDYPEAIQALRAIEAPPKSITGREEIWGLSHILAREAMKTGDYRAAYDLCRNIGLDSGADFAEAEFLAGFLALRFLDEPETAEAHFVRLAEGVSTPVSLSRGWYWTGRAREAQGDDDGARDAYEKAAGHISAFYGQLAAVKLDPVAALAVPPDPQADEETRDRFAGRELVRALHMLGELGAENMFWTFARHLEDELDDPAEIVLLSDMAQEYGMPRTALRVAKDGRNRALDIFDRAFPVAFTPPEGPQYAEPALALAISRQETEFDPRAVSGANARGLMQLLPSTAQLQASRSGLPYRANWLLDDPQYNAQLGSAHLFDLTQDYNGSYIVSMAGYNAGPSAARRWLEENGDPRSSSVDPVDWIEMITYGETRNYIQRVMENLQVYRARLNGGAATIEIAQDLRRGELPRSAIR